MNHIDSETQSDRQTDEWRLAATRREAQMFAHL